MEALRQVSRVEWVFRNGYKCVTLDDFRKATDFEERDRVLVHGQWLIVTGYDPERPDVVTVSPNERAESQEIETSQITHVSPRFAVWMADDLDDVPFCPWELRGAYMILAESYGLYYKTGSDNARAMAYGQACLIHDITSIPLDVLWDEVADVWRGLGMRGSEPEAGRRLIRALALRHGFFV